MELFTFVLLTCFDSLANHSENTQKYDPEPWTRLALSKNRTLKNLNPEKPGL